ncbi:MAG TPA: hypothetical protein VGT44_10400 [Ktedonobacteraceae bacterium]|nr:hypothetical protein [Ktedonobacteraceae bacterium]
MSDRLDRLYTLLPRYYRQRDADERWPLQALLHVIAEQVNVVEDDIAQLYENWFIETCQDWVVPYIGDLIGYEIVHDAGEPGDITTLEGKQRNKIMIPRREVANTIRYRRRRGSLALLDQLAHDVAGWYARAVEFYLFLAQTQSLNQLRLDRGRLVSVRDDNNLHRVNSPFGSLAHMVDVRRIDSSHTPGRYNIPEIGLFVWRLKVYPVTRAPAYCVERVAPECYTFSVLGNDSPLYTNPEPQVDPTRIPEALNLPMPIGRRAFKNHKTSYYGESKSMQIWIGVRQHKDDGQGGTGQSEHAFQHQASEGSHRHQHHGEHGSDHSDEWVVVKQPVPAEHIVPANLSDWHYRPHHGEVAVDPELGRIVFPEDELPVGVWVSYYYGFSADISGGEYNRPLSQPAEYSLYRVGEGEQYETLQAALDAWDAAKEALEQSEIEEPGETASQERHEERKERAAHPELLHAIIEIADNRVYTEELDIELEAYESLQIRAANYARPVIHLLDRETNLPDSWYIAGDTGSRFSLDGLLLTGRGVKAEGKLASLCIRHCTLVPGWEIHDDCQPGHPAAPGLELSDMSTLVTIEHSILGPIHVRQNEARMDPLTMRISDSILDATGVKQEALTGPGCPVAPAVLTIERSTVFGQVEVHAIDLAENTIFNGLVKVARRQEGCMRFCYAPYGSRTPHRYNCQPDLVVQLVDEDEAGETLPDTDKAQMEQSERERVRPLFNSTRYGSPTYCQLSNNCALEISHGADDEAELGVYHDLFQPQREANLRTRLNEYIPAGMDASIVFAS